MPPALHELPWTGTRKALDVKPLELLTQQQTIHAINALAAREIPFVFLISFMGEENLVGTPTEAAGSGLFLDMPGMKNHVFQKLRRKKDPVAQTSAGS
jgi:hypothetical protein